MSETNNIITTATNTDTGQKYELIYASDFISQFTKLGKRNAKLKSNGDLELKNKNLTVVINGFNKLEIKTSIFKTFDYLLLKATNSSNGHVTIELKDYMQARGLTFREKAYRQLRTDLETLSDLKITFEKKTKGKDNPFTKLPIISALSYNKGVFHIVFEPTLFSILKKYKLMNYPLDILKTNDTYNRNSYYIERKLAEHKNMNTGKSNENIISVKSLIEVLPKLPTFEELKKGEQSCKRNLINPFLRDLNAVKGLKSFCFMNDLDKQLQINEVEALSYHSFINLKILFEFSDYPKNEKEQIKEKNISGKN